MADSTNVNFGTLINVVRAHATTYEDALTDLQDSANSSKTEYWESPDGTATSNMEVAGYTKKYNLGEVSITDATVATTKVQLTQSLTEMASGIAKNAADHTKGLGRKIGGG
jgi:hypothetical protein